MASSAAQPRYAGYPTTSPAYVPVLSLPRPTCVDVQLQAHGQELATGMLTARAALHSDVQAYHGVKPKVHVGLGVTQM